MNDIAMLKSYLVGLGFAVDANQYRQFNNVLAEAARSVKRETASIGFDLVKWQVGIVGLFASVSTGILAMMDKVSKADQEYRLFGERMFMSTQNARSLKIALDALGQPLEAIAFDPELHDRFLQLQKDQQRLTGGLGGDFESNMKRLRDVSFELDRLKVELQYLAMGTVNELFKAVFGDDDILKHLKEINNWLIDHIPQLAKQFSTYLVPVLKDTWSIVKDVGGVLGVMANEFANLVGTLSGDDSLRSSSFDFDKFARAVGKAVHELAELLGWVLKIEKHLPVLEILGGAAAGATLGSVIPGVGTGVGALVGGGLGAAFGIAGRYHGPVAGDGTASIQSATAAGSSDIAREAQKQAYRVSQLTGIPPDLIYGQWAHETGGFTNRGAKSLNNLAGIRQGDEYRKFDSIEEFANYYTKLISSKRYSSKGALNARTPEQFAGALKAGGYYEDSFANYSRGIRNMESGYSNGGNTTSVSVGDINIMQPNANPDQIKKAVIDGVQESRDKQTQRNLAQLTPVFQ